MSCVYCGKQILNKGSLKSHELRCKLNPDKITFPNPQKGKTAWNKGLTKETSPIVAEIARKVSQSTTGKKGTPHSEETRKKLSEICKKRYRDNPELHPNRRLASNRSKMTYPERVAQDWLSRKQIPFLYNERVGKYYPDFLVGSIIIEIDGERWHPEDSENDKSRDDDLRSMGYTIFRIRSRECIEDKLAEIFNMDLDPESFKPLPRKPKSVVPKKEKKVRYTENYLDSIFSQVTNSDIDLFSYGWVSKVSKLWGVSHTLVRKVFSLYWRGPQPYSRNTSSRDRSD